jgi:hypothetical protein
VEFLEEQSSKLQNLFKSTVSLFGEEPAKVKMDEFINVFKTFSQLFLKCWSENKVEREKEIQIEKRRQMIKV